ncbi:AtpZ/AtpI family protein [Kiloniella laminariae]|uniref:ATP synthase protein I n=1 Tax=Kiloniella laminariae TaxID=454162 RepID=A0ABT4LN97_9PROT|nr:AtpZ/AtpI family protein [Kiloniella laminariae]MCZ4281806.1 AtpZ/AtpI family protein [Kiloniella laminariae]
MPEPEDNSSLTDLDTRLRAARERQEKVNKPASRNQAEMASGMAVGFRIAVEIVAALIMGFGIGYYLDLWLGTKPWLMIIFFFLGIGAAFINVIRVAKQLENKKRFRDTREDDAE